MGFDVAKRRETGQFLCRQADRRQDTAQYVTTPGTPVDGEQGRVVRAVADPRHGRRTDRPGRSIHQRRRLEQLRHDDREYRREAAAGFWHGSRHGAGREPDSQPNLEVVLRDEKAQAAALNPKTLPGDKGVELKTKTAADGSFVFDKVPPGKYTITATKPISGRIGQQPVTVEAGKTVTVTDDVVLEIRCVAGLGRSAGANQAGQKYTPPTSSNAAMTASPA